MLFGSWINKALSPLGAYGKHPSRSRKASQPRRQRLRIEALEDRSLLSAVVVTNCTDDTDGDIRSIDALIRVPGADRTISLREAIEASNNTAGANRITFDPATSGTPIRLTQALPSISNAVTITGLGAANTTVSGGGDWRLIDIAPALDSVPFDVTLDGLTLTGGKTREGGAIRTSQTGTVLTVTNSTISNNRADVTGGGIWSFGTVTVINSTIAGNSSRTAGGIYSQGAVTISNSTISGNTASGGHGGGIYSATFGLSLTVSNSTISGNSAVGYGGGIEVRGKALITDSTISHNSANPDFGGGGIDVGRGASVTIIRSTISDNYAGYGAGIYADTFSVVTVSNSTIADNRRADYGGGIYSAGAVTASNSTIAGNSANFGGGGIYCDGDATVRSSIVAGNFDSEGSPDLAVGSSLSVTNSLIGDSSGTGLEPTSNGAPDVYGNFIGTRAAPLDPRLGPLADNGGPTQTMALGTGSPALDRGANPDGLAYDQRGPGFVRVSGSQTDMGAFEVQQLPVVLSVQQQIALIVGQANSLVATGSLNTGNGNALTVKLKNAIASFNSGNIDAGVNQLNAFINQVNAFVKSHRLTSTDAQTLSSAIDEAIAGALANPI